MTINSWIIWCVSGAYVLLLGVVAVLLVINADQRASLAADDAAKTLLLTQNKAWAKKTAASNAALAKIKAADAANAELIAEAEASAAIGEKKLQNEAALIAGLAFPGSDCDQSAALAESYLTNGSLGTSWPGLSRPSTPLPQGVDARPKAGHDDAAE